MSETHRTQALDPYLKLSQQFVTIEKETTWLQNFDWMNPVMDLMLGSAVPLVHRFLHLCTVSVVFNLPLEVSQLEIGTILCLTHAG